MSYAHALAGRLQRRGVRLALTVRVEAVKGLLDERDRRQLAEQRDELVRLLAWQLVGRYGPPPLPGPGLRYALDRVEDGAVRIVDEDGVPVVAGLFVSAEQARSWARGRGWMPVA